MESLKCPFCSGALKTLDYHDLVYGYGFYEVGCSTCNWQTYAQSEKVDQAWAAAREFCNMVQQTLIRSWQR